MSLDDMKPDIWTYFKDIEIKFTLVLLRKEIKLSFYKHSNI